MSDFSVDELRRLSEAATLRRVAPRFGRPAGSASAKLAAASGLARNDHVWMSTHCSERCAGNRRSQHESAATTPPLPRRDGAAVSGDAKSVNAKKNGHANGVPMNGAHASQLRPFFGYYGGKWRDALKHYPEPDHETIVEPFAGSAGFSLRYAHRKIILCEIDPVLSEVWRYLIRVKAKEILAIPDLDPEGTIDDLKVPQEAKWLVGFWLNRGAASPRKSPSKWMREGIRPGSFWGPRVRQTIASQVDSIRHWQLFNCSYADAPTPRTATWFVDPPYEAAGRHYRFGSEQLDYEALGAWCRSRPGQVIVCENEGATWLPFRELADVKTTRADRRSKEVIWLSTENGHRPSPKRDSRYYKAWKNGTSMVRVTVGPAKKKEAG